MAIDSEDPREVPIHIDSSDRFGESMVVLIVTFMVGNILRTLFGIQENGIPPAFGIGFVVAIYYYRLSRGKPDGFLLHRISTLTNLSIKGLISSSVKRIRR